MRINNKSCCTWPERQGRRPANRILIAGSVLAALLAFCAPPARAFGSDAPDWLRAVATVPLPKYPDDAKAVVLLNDETVSVQSNGDLVEHFRIAYKILHTSGRDRGTIGVPYFSEQTKITSMKGWCIPATGKEMAVTEKDAIERDLFDNETYSDLREQILIAPAPDPGNVIGFEYEIHTRPYLLQETWEIQGEDPVREARMTLQVPAGWEYDAHWINHPDVAAQQDGPNQWHWDVQDVAGVDAEEDAPPEEALAERAVLNFFPSNQDLRDKTLDSWKDLGLWQARLADGRRDDSPDIEAKVKQLTASAATPIDKARAITEWMQSEIRYYAIDMGIGGYQPHPATWVFAHQYGDCKDKATLLSSMLKDIGIDSYYVFIRDERGVVRPGDPPDSNDFNHAILAIRLPADVPTGGLYATYQHPRLGTLLFFDPTNALVPFGYIPWYLQANYGLLVTDQGGELVELPLLEPPTNRLIRSAQLSLSSTGDLQGTVKEIRWGDPAAETRSEIRDAQAKDAGTDVLESFLARFLPGAELTQANAENLDKNSENLILNYQFAARNYSQSSGNMLLVRPRVLGEWSNTLLEDTSKPRKYTVDLGATKVLSDFIEISLPPGYVASDLPDPVKIDYPFASYNSKVECDGKVLRYSRTMQIKSVLVPTEQLADLKKFYEQIAEDESASAVLMPAASN